MKLSQIFLFIFLLSRVLSAQSWEAILVSGDTTRNLSFTKIQGEVLLATQEGHSLTDIQTFNIDRISELRFLSKKKIRPNWKTRLVGISGGSLIGYGAGYMMGNIILWWLSYEELGALKLLGPRPENMNDGQRLITGIAIKLVTTIGIAGGYDWGTKIVDNVKSYDLRKMPLEERKNNIKEAIWSTKSQKRSTNLFNQLITALKKQIIRE